MTGHQVDRARWATLTILEQMGNIYSEVGRSLAARRAGDRARFEHALTRARDLFDATLESVEKDKPFRAREILRAKEQYLQLFSGEQIDASEAESLERYFYHFALAARRGR